jgi:hypothetical protein
MNHFALNGRNLLVVGIRALRLCNGRAEQIHQSVVFAFAECVEKGFYYG